MENKVPIVHSVSMALIDRPDIPDRMTIEEEDLKELRESIDESGLKQPVLLRTKGARFEIVAGDRRYLACMYLKHERINAFIEQLTDTDVSVMRAIENLQRTNLTIIEEAKVYKRMHNDHKMTWDQIGKRTGKSPANIKRRYDLLKLPDILVNALHKKLIGYAVAEELKRLHDVERIKYYLNYAVDHGATKEVVRSWVDEEQSALRQKIVAGGEGGGEYTTPEPRPVFVACDICRDPVDVMKIVGLRICGNCQGTIKQNM